MKTSWLQLSFQIDTAYNFERSRLLNWLPVSIALGIAVYFSLPFEPDLPLVTGITLVLWGGVILGKFNKKAPSWVLLVTVTLALVAAGLSIATIRTELVKSPILEYEIGPRFVEGTIIAIEPSSPGQRFLIGDLGAEAFRSQPIPDLIRLRSNSREGNIEVGMRIRALAVMRPPSQPVYPSGFNFARQAYFKNIGAVGYIWGKLKILEMGKETDNSSLINWNNLRQKIVKKVDEHLVGSGRDLAITFLTGQKGSISRKTKESIRKSGLAHLLAISGLHMGLVAGIVFNCLRFFMAAYPPLALRYPIKKIAAFSTLIICFGYLALIGMPLSAQRAFMMVAIGLIAIMLDRQALSMRTVSVAALVLLILSPEVLISASFQLSFAAVIALVAVFEWYSVNKTERSSLQKFLNSVKVTFLCSLVASLATAPFVLYHFNSIPLFGILANLVAVPFTALVLMPLTLITYVLMPLGLEGVSLLALGWAFEFLLWVADSVSSLPNGELRIPAFPTWFLSLIIFGGLWICLLQSRVRWMGAVPVMIFCLFLGLIERSPDLLVDGKTGLIGISFEENLYVSQTRKARFVSRTWQRNLAAKSIKNWVDLPEDIFQCDEESCLLKIGERQVSFVINGMAFNEDCLRSNYLVAKLKVPPWCKRDNTDVIDYWDLRKEGSHSVSFASDRVKIITVKEATGLRPWVNQ